ncbi:MAG: DUF2220 family protein, partial [Desulfobacterales bacterium]|nr:DUF2220 family protein [Desulfobacterales bacterium]
ADGKVTFPARPNWESIGNPPLPKWVMVAPARIRSDCPEDFSAVPWVPELGFWPELKPGQLTAAKCINDFLLKRRGSLRIVPIKERSLQIFGDEKRLDMMRTGETLFMGRLKLETLGAFAVPLPLPYRQADAPGQPVLVVENHNSFWSFGEWNHDIRKYAAVVYGSGEAFRLTGAALGQVLREVDGIGALYLGDLDVKGVRIPAEFNAAPRGDSPLVQPAMELYAWLLANGLRREKSECRGGTLIHATNWLGAELGEKVHAMWQEGRWIPQEALGLEQLLQ